MEQALQAAIEARLGVSILDVREVGGGDVNRAFRIRSSAGLIFAKVNDHAPSAMFQREAHGLALLHDAAVFRVPKVLGTGRAGGFDFLLLEWIDTRSSPSGSSRVFGQALATLHQHHNPRFGLDRDNFIGDLPQLNDFCESWLAFFRDQRLAAQLAIAGRRGSLATGALQRAEKLLGRLDRWLPTRSKPSLLHGDLWAGNHMTDARGDTILIDPAVYYGDREIELAFTELFGGFDAAFYAGYDAVWPREPGYLERRDLYNLYPLLVHANLFGGHYGSRVDGIVRRYL